VIFVLNTIIILFWMMNSHKLKRFSRVVIWFGIIILTISISVIGYPQESNPHILMQSKHDVIAIKSYKNITKDDLNLTENRKKEQNINPDERYVVALFKYKIELPVDGTYKLYQREPVYFYDSRIRSIGDIPVKLIGYQKVIWWYLKTFKD